MKTLHFTQLALTKITGNIVLLAPENGKMSSDIIIIIINMIILMITIIIITIIITSIITSIVVVIVTVIMITIIIITCQNL